MTIQPITRLGAMRGMGNEIEKFSLEGIAEVQV